MQIQSIIFLILPLLFTPLKWYQQLIADNITLTRNDVNGIYVLFEDRGRIALIYLFCIIIQFMVIQNKQFIYSVIAQFILVIVLTFFPVYFFPISLAGAYFISTFFIGYYVAVIFIIINIVINVIRFLKKYDTRNKFLYGFF